MKGNAFKAVGKIAIMNLVLGVIFLEAGSLMVYYFQTHHFFYTREAPEKIKDLDINEDRMDLLVVERLHPFFGFVQKPGPDFRPGFSYNSFGFISPFEYPFIKANENQMIIGVFGGSVASNYSIFEIQNRILESTFKQHPAFAEKELIFLSFATGGYKQPQQLLILNYMLAAGQELDFVINIDGFNEMALSSLNSDHGLGVMMPSVSHVSPLTSLANNSLSATSLEALFRIQKSKSEFKDLRYRLQNTSLASIHTLLSLRMEKVLRQYRVSVQIFQQAQQHPDKSEQRSAYHYYPLQRFSSPSDLWIHISDTWMNTSLLMSQILAARNIPYLQVLQPNQYHITQRTFGADERKVAFQEDSPYREAIEKGYPFLLERIPRLRAAGVEILDAVKIFDQSPDSMYIDSCCHYTDEGHLILSTVLADRILSILNSEAFPIEK